MVMPRQPGGTLEGEQIEMVVEASAYAKTISSALVSDSAAECERVEESFPTIPAHVTDPADRAQWRAYLLAVMRRAVEVLEGR